VAVAGLGVVTGASWGAGAAAGNELTGLIDMVRPSGQRNEEKNRAASGAQGAGEASTDQAARPPEVRT